MDKMILLCCLLTGIESAVYLALQNEIPGHPNQCYDRNRTKFYDKGQVMENEFGERTCGQKRCLGKSDREGKVLTEFVTCGVIDKKVAPKKLKVCNVTSDLGPYPECCVPYENLATPEFCDSISSSPNADSSDNNRL